jgi:hypothetical protein
MVTSRLGLEQIVCTPEELLRPAGMLEGTLRSAQTCPESCGASDAQYDELAPVLAQREDAARFSPARGATSGFSL